MHARYLVTPLLAFVVTVTSADTLVMPRKDDLQTSAAGMLRPVRGMTMETVLARFGEPRKRLPAVGDPPITRWIYEEFTVYFEGDLTLHAVVRRR